MSNALSDFLSPKCIHCDAAIADGDEWCGDCDAELFPHIYGVGDDDALSGCHCGSECVK